MEKNIGVYEIRIYYGNGDKNMTEMDEAKKLGYLYPSSSPGKLKMRARYQDCADCLCRVCSRSVLNDSHNSTQKVTDLGCNPCHHCTEVIEKVLGNEHVILHLT